MVTVYTKDNCVQCNATVRQLRKLSIPHELVSATDNLDVLKSRGYLTAPVVHVNTEDYEDWWSGFNVGKIRSLTEVLN